MGVFRAHRWVSLFAIAGLLMRIGIGIMFAPMLSGAALADRAYSASTGSDLQTIIICTGTGFKKITIDRDGNPVDGEQIPEDCPLCIAMSAITFALPDEAASISACAGTDGAYEAFAQNLQVLGLDRSVRNRSPPSHI